MSSDRAVTEGGAAEVALIREGLGPDERAFLAVLDEFVRRIRASEPRITAGVCAVVPAGAELCRLDSRFKTDESLHRKARAIIKRNKREFSSAKSSESLAQMAFARIDDALRYSLLSSEAALIVQDASGFLYAANDGLFSVIKLVDMYSNDSRYKGLHANLKHDDRSEEVVFEVQFHSPESLVADAATHVLYEEYRSSDDAERRQLLHDEIKGHYASVPSIDTSTRDFPVKVEVDVFKRPVSPNKR